MSYDHAGNDHAGNDDTGNDDPRNPNEVAADELDGDPSSSTAVSSTAECSGDDGGGADPAGSDGLSAAASHDAHESADPERPEPEPEPEPETEPEPERHEDVDVDGAEKEKEDAAGGFGVDDADEDADDDADDNFRKRKVLFGDCALVEIIHLHDCLRGALRALHRDVTELARTAAAAVSSSSSSAATAGVGGGRKATSGGRYSEVEACDKLAELERRVAARFKVIWSVFRAHSAAEDEFIWPALRSKITLSPPRQHQDRGDHAQNPPQHHWRLQDQGPGLERHQPPPAAAAAAAVAVAAQDQNNEGGHHDHINLIEPEEYEEDHADEERMFLEMDKLLSKLRAGLQSPHGGGGKGSSGAVAVEASGGTAVKRGAVSAPVAPAEEPLPATGSPASTAAVDGLQHWRRRREHGCCRNAAVRAMTTEIQAMSGTLSRHLLRHLEKEEVQCMPLVLEHLSKSEITDLVGKIMGKRSSDLMSQILTMAVQTLPEAEREDMVGYMRQAMVGTFFERWLAMEGFWSLTSKSKTKLERVATATVAPGTASASDPHPTVEETTRDGDDDEGDRKMSLGEARAIDGEGEDSDCARDNPSAAHRPGSSIPTPTSAAEAADATSGIEREADAFSSALPIAADACRGTYASGGDHRRRCRGVAASTKPAAPAPPFDCAAASVAVCPRTSSGTTCLLHDVNGGDDRTITREELEKLIRSIGSNQGLTAVQKSTTIQGLRDSVWESNRRRSNSVGGAGEGDDGGGVKRKLDGSFYGNGGGGAAAATHRRCNGGEAVAGRQMTTHQALPQSTRAERRGTAPTFYYKKDDISGEVRLVWSSESPSMKVLSNRSIPLFSASELAPTYHDGATAAVLGCPHYARSCKLRHPSSGRLYTCRLCCEQEREMPLKVQDSPLDRYSVSEVLCMHCETLQPANDHCVNPKCDARGRPFAKYTCKICNLYDDGSHKRIYHCPFCNVCRAGSGLGIDFRHCMRCNACVSLGDDGEHVCISQRLQGNCPICHETMFESTEPLKGLKCGHVMHLKCFTLYRRAVYTCPLCKKSVEDMKEYFSMMDAAVRMQPMPAVYSHISSKIYCQDCCKTGKVQYHFVGCKCKHCGSYNTREIERCAEAS